MAPLLVSHPVLLNDWMMARETALARVRAPCARAIAHAHKWSVEDARQMARIEVLRQELPEVTALVAPGLASEALPWDRLIRSTSGLSLETQKLDVARQVQALAHDLGGAPEGQSGVEFLLRHPGHRNAVKRVLIAARHP